MSMNDVIRGQMSGALGGLDYTAKSAFAGQFTATTAVESPVDAALKRIHGALARLNDANSTMTRRVSKVVPQVIGEGTLEKPGQPDPGGSELASELFSIARQIEQQAQGVEFVSNRIEL